MCLQGKLTLKPDVLQHYIDVHQDILINSDVLYNICKRRKITKFLRISELILYPPD